MAIACWLSFTLDARTAAVIANHRFAFMGEMSVHVQRNGRSLRAMAVCLDSRSGGN